MQIEGIKEYQQDTVHIYDHIVKVKPSLPNASYTISVHQLEYIYVNYTLLCYPSYCILLYE